MNTRKTLHELMSLDGKTALIIGGGGWLGRAIVEATVELGANTIVAGAQKCESFNDDKQWLIDLIDSKSVRYFDVDVTSPDSVEQLKNNILQDNKLDILVNCFWKGEKSGWQDTTLANWKNDIDVNVNGAFIVCKTFTDNVIKAQGTILNVSSMYSTVAPRATMYKGVPQTNPPGYGAAKAAVNQLTRYLASFLGEHGVTANAISPGPFPFPEIENQFPEFAQRLTEQTMVGRIGTPDDLKGIVAILVSDAGRYITGQNIAVDGGWTSW